MKSDTHMLPGTETIVSHEQKLELMLVCVGEGEPVMVDDP